MPPENQNGAGERSTEELATDVRQPVGGHDTGHQTAVDGRPTADKESDESVGKVTDSVRVPLYRRDALASLVSLGGLTLFATERAHAQGRPPRWRRLHYAARRHRLLDRSAVLGQSPTVITDCTTITEPGTYVLGRHLEGTTADQPTGRPHATACISIRSSDVVFDGNGHTIQGSGNSDWAIHATAESNVTVKNVHVSDWARGIEFFQCSNSAVYDCTVTATAFGILLAVDADDNLVENNIVRSSTRWGFTVEGSNNQIARNTATENAFFGIQVIGRGGRRATGNLLTENTVRDNGESSPSNDGIFTFRADANRFTGNDVVGNAGNGIELIDSSRNIVTGNTVCGNGEGAIVTTGDSVDNVIRGNTTECRE